MEAVSIMLAALGLALLIGWLLRDMRAGVVVLALFALGMWLDTVEPVADWMRGVQDERWFTLAKGGLVGLLIALSAGRVWTRGRAQ